MYISYGQKTSGQLLLSYGFMPEAGTNPHDACMLELKLSEDDPTFQSKAACLRQYGAEATRDFPLRLDALPQALLLFAAFQQAQTRDAAEVMFVGRELFEEVCFLKFALIQDNSVFTWLLFNERLCASRKGRNLAYAGCSLLQTLCSDA